MSSQIDRAGIFKAKPLSWKVRVSQETKSVSVAIEWGIEAQLDGADWQDWRQYDVVCWGNHVVVKKDGTPNMKMVEQLAKSINWNGNLRQVNAGPPPDVIAQITVKEDHYNGKTTFKADWVNPEDYVPTGGGADDDEVAALDAQFGSLLRAAAGSAKPAAKATPPKPKPAAPPQPDAEPPVDTSSIPF